MGDGLELQLEQRGYAGEDRDVLHHDQRVPHEPVPPQVRALGDLGHAQRSVVASVPQPASQDRLERRVAHDRHAERQRDGWERDVVVRRPDTAAGEHVRERFAGLGVIADGMTPKQFEAFLAKEYSKLGSFIERNRAQLSE